MDAGGEQPGLTMHKTATGGKVERLEIVDSVEDLESHTEDEWVVWNSEDVNDLMDTEAVHDLPTERTRWKAKRVLFANWHGDGRLLQGMSLEYQRRVR